VGKVGVWIFFVLSAFLLTRQFLETSTTSLSRYTLANYAFRRFFRIIPLYVLTLLIYVPFSYVVTRANFVDHLTFQEGKGHLWTVVAEVQYYFLLPLLAIGLTKLLDVPRGMATTLLVALWIASIVIFPPSAFEISTTSVTAYLCIFLAGSIAAFLFVRLGVSMPARWANALMLVALSIIVVTLPSVWSFIVEPVAPDYFYRAYPMFALVSVALVASAAAAHSWADRIFSSSPLQFLGKISFSGYLIHPLLLRLTSGYAHTVGTAIAALISAAVILIASYVLYGLIEHPLSRLRLRSRRPSLAL
jgi:peptidoglycan/LPS O-acetylase OafA/YrhL